jgi:hypothetical protein
MESRLVLDAPAFFSGEKIVKLPKTLYWVRPNAFSLVERLPEDILAKADPTVDPSWHRWMKVEFDEGSVEYFCGDFQCQGACHLPKLVAHVEERNGDLVVSHRTMCSALCGIEQAFGRPLPDSWKGEVREYPVEAWEHLRKFWWV